MQQESAIYERYQRQLILPGMGREGQAKLMRSRVLMIGAGGLGCPVLQYLTAAGVGTIGIIDDDVVALNNLHRQVLYAVPDIGLSKAETAARVLGRLNPEVQIIPYPARLTTTNAWDLLSAYDIIIDGTDNFSTRYMVNDACVLLDKPLVSGAISQYEGQVAVLNYPVGENAATVNYRDIFPHPPSEAEVLNCADAGVLGVLPGIIGGMMANEVIKMITGTGTVLAGKLLTYNTLNNQVYVLSIFPAKDTRLLIPADREAFLRTDYLWLCASPIAAPEIAAATFSDILKAGGVDIVDVRELYELPELTGLPTLRIPLAQLEQEKDRIQAATVVVICQTGKRSLQAARLLAGIFGSEKKVYSLKGGLSGRNAHDG